MKKTIIALLALAGVAFGVEFGSNVSITSATGVAGAETVTRDTGMDFTYVAGGEQIVTTLDDSITIYNMAGTPDNAANVTLTLNIKGDLDVRNRVVLGKGDSFKANIKTDITTSELTTLAEDGTVSRWVLTTDFVENFSTSRVALTLGGLDGYADGGLVIDYNGDYYSFSDATVNGSGYVNLSSTATAIELADETVYTTIMVTATGTNASVKGVGFVATALIPEPTTATLSLLALAGLAARRRRK